MTADLWMDGEQMSHVLQDLLCDVMGEWNDAGVRALRTPMAWENLDPISRALYIQRCERFLERYDVTPKP